jgi:predicted phosphodiesterase
LYVAQHYPAPGDTPPEVTKNTIEPSPSQDLLYLYWNSWNKTLRTYTIENKFTEKIIKTNINGFVGNYSVNDILPFQKIKHGLIDVNFYKGSQDEDMWYKRQGINNVAVIIPIDEAITKAGETSETDDQAKNQYFLNENSDKRIVIFGHTHDPKIIASDNYSGQKSIYANSGTWIDHNGVASSTMTFVVITPQSNEASSKTFVRLYNFKNDIITEMAEDSLRY